MPTSMAATDTGRATEWAPTVLIIEDDSGARDSVAMLLELHGFQVVTARNGKQGMQAFRAALPDAVVTDIIMPEKDGLEVIREIRRERGDVGIIAVSGGARINDADLATVATKLGADAGFLKPFDPAALMDALLALLGRGRNAAAPAAVPA